MSEAAYTVNGRIPTGIAICCREWIVPLYSKGGSCGLCGERPTFSHDLPESEWVTPSAPINEAS
jgi:hypothetical protein